MTIVYETTLIQYRPIVSSEERANVGVLIFSPDTGQLLWRLTDHYRRLGQIFPGLDGKVYRSMRRAFDWRIQRIAGKPADPQQGVMIGLKSLQALMALLLPSDGSNFVGTSIRFGTCLNLALRLDELFEEFVARLERQHHRERIDNEMLWERVTSDRAFRRAAPHLTERVTLKTRRYDYTFHAGWQNGQQQLVEPITLDYIDPGEMVDRAVSWCGRLRELGSENKFSLVAIVTDPPEDHDRARYEKAVELLQDAPGLREVITQSRIPTLAQLILKDVEGQGSP